MMMAIVISGFLQLTLVSKVLLDRELKVLKVLLEPMVLKVLLDRELKVLKVLLVLRVFREYKENLVFRVPSVLTVETQEHSIT